MKILTVMMCLSVLLFHLSGAELKTVSGKVYKNAELRKIAAGCVQIVHNDGIATIAWDDLPESFIVALNSSQRKNLLTLADIKLKDGRTLQRCTLSFLGDSEVEITHLQGSDKVKLTDLPDNLLAVLDRTQLAKAQGKTLKRSSSGNAAVKDQPTGEKRPDGKIIYQGPRGGRYYINDNGRKVYIRDKE